VRKALAACTVVLGVLSCALAQEQERKLIDRLLRPDLTLANHAQDKKFTAAEGASIDKRATVHAFYFQTKSNAKNFSATRRFTTPKFISRLFGRTRSADGASKSVTSSQPAYATQSARGVRDVPQSGKKVASATYAGNRPFLDEGKSQKALNQKNAPLTIEQVRELLNKNK
jgi:hypothetical protein